MKEQLTIGIDCDDVLMPCAEYAIQLANKNEFLNNPILLEEINGWGKTGKRTDIIFDYFKKSHFYKTQPVYPGAKEFISQLIEMGYDVVIPTAIYSDMTEIRINRIKEEFPMLPEANIIPITRKDLCKVDVHLDDAPHNIFNSAATYPVLFRQPWNRHITGIPAINNYNEFFELLKRIEQDRNNGNTFNLNEPLLFCLIGPSGSGKTAITHKVIEISPGFAAPVSCTTRTMRDGETKNAYYFITNSEFQQIKAKGEFAEFTDYASCQYGVKKSEIESIWESGKHAIMPVDISGANALKAIYGDKVVMCYIKRNKNEIIKEIIYRCKGQLDKNNEQITDKILEDKYNRIISLDDEFKNSQLCDIIIPNNKSIIEAAQMLINFIRV